MDISKSNESNLHDTKQRKLRIKHKNHLKTCLFVQWLTLFSRFSLVSNKIHSYLRRAESPDFQTVFQCKNRFHRKKKPHNDWLDIKGPDFDAGVWPPLLSFNHRASDVLLWQQKAPRAWLSSTSVAGTSISKQANAVKSRLAAPSASMKQKCL